MLLSHDRAKENNPELLSIQYLRGLAALMVVVHHALGYLYYDRPGPFWQPQLAKFWAGAGGVDIFFVISGFVMALVVTRRRPSGQAFAMQRLARVAPVYWLASLAMLIYLLLDPALRRPAQFGTEFVLRSLAFVPPTADPAVLPLLAPGWTLILEAGFYGCIAIGLCWWPRWALIVAAGLAGLLGLSGLGELRSGTLLDTYLNGRMLEFTAGVVLHGLWHRGSLAALGPRWGGCLVASGFASLLVIGASPQQPHLVALYWGGPAAIIIAGALAMERSLAARPITALRRLGDASYSIYLVHMFPILALHGLRLPVDGALGVSWQFAAGFGGSLLLGLLAWRWIERPVVAAAQRAVGRHRSAVAPN